MIDLVNERYEKDVAFYRQEIDKLNEEIKKIDEEITRIGILACQTTDDRVHNVEIKKLETKKESLERFLKNSKEILETILNDYSKYKEMTKGFQDIF